MLSRASGNVIGGAGEGEGNLSYGMFFVTRGTECNTLRGNLIGTDITGRRALPNETGVHIDGGTVENVVVRNVISGNIVAGITLFAVNTDRNRIEIK
jgi:hypothetical protein